jgi:hypothetical protein
MVAVHLTIGGDRLVEQGLGRQAAEGRSYFFQVAQISWKKTTI